MELLASEHGLRLVEFLGPDLADYSPESPFLEGLRDSVENDPRPVVALAIITSAQEQLAQYFEGVRREFTLPLDLVGTPFQQSVWRALCSVDYATTISYRELATRVGRPAAIRSAAAANGANPVSIIVPCHRILGSDGSLTGYAAGLEIKRALLELERSVAGRGSA